MKNAWPMVLLGQVLKESRDAHAVDREKSYPNFGIYSYARGLFLKPPIDGMATSASTLYRARKGQFVYSRLFAFEGAYGVVPAETDGYFVSNEFPLFDADEQQLSPVFLHQYISVPRVWREIAEMGTGVGDRRQRVHPEHILSYSVPLPPIAEQRRIVARIEHLVGNIAGAQKLRREASVEANALLASGIASAVGTRHELSRLGEFLTDPPRNGWSARCDGDDSGVAVLSLGAITGFTYRASQFKRTSEATLPNARYWLRPGDLLMTRSNTPELVGHAATFTGEPYPCIYPDLMMRLNVNERKACKRFVHIWLQGGVARDYVRSNAKGTSPTMKKISQGVVMNIPFPIIALSEQQRVVAKFEGLFAQVEALKRNQMLAAAELEALVPSMLDQAFKGEL